MSKHSEVTKAKIRATSKKRVFSDEETSKRTKASIEITSKPVICLTNGKTYSSISEASREFHTAPICISRVCNGQRSSCHKHIFRFL